MVVAPNGVINPYARRPNPPNPPNPPSAGAADAARASFRSAADLLAEEERAMEIEEEAMVLSGGRAILRHKVGEAIRELVIAPLNAHRTQVQANERAKRVAKATKETVATDKADRITAVLAKERSVTRVVLDGLITEKATEVVQIERKKNPDETEVMRRKMQSMQAQLDNNQKLITELSKNVKGSGAGKAGRGNGSHRSAGGRAAAQNKSHRNQGTPTNRGTPAGRGIPGGRGGRAGRGTPSGRGGRGGATGGRSSASTSGSSGRRGGRSPANANGRRRGPPTSSRK